MIRDRRAAQGRMSQFCTFHTLAIHRDHRTWQLSRIRTILSVNLEPVVQFTIAVPSEGCECIGNFIGDGLLCESVGRPYEVTNGLR